MSESSGGEFMADQEPRPNTWAIVSLMLGFAAWIWAVQLFVMFDVPYPLPWHAGFDKLIMLAIVCSPIASVICGCVARTNAQRNPMLRGTWAATVGITLSLALWFLPLSLVLPQFFRHRGMNAPHCAENLKSIAVALKFYSDDNPLGRTPATLDALMNGSYRYLDSTRLQCPKHKKKYVYVATNQVWASNSTDIAAYCLDEHHGNVWVAYLNCRVAAITPVELNQALATTNNVAPTQPE